MGSPGRRDAVEELATGAGEPGAKNKLGLNRRELSAAGRDGRWLLGILDARPRTDHRIVLSACARAVLSAYLGSVRHPGFRSAVTRSHTARHGGLLGGGETGPGGWG